MATLKGDIKDDIIKLIEFNTTGISDFNFTPSLCLRFCREKVKHEKHEM